MAHRHSITFVTKFSTMFTLTAALATFSSVLAEDTTPAPAQPAAATDATVKPAAGVASTGAAAVVTTETPQPAPAPAAPVQYVPAGDPYGFTGWLNSVRAQYGLRPVGYDPNLTNWAAVNNQHQASRGMGHFVMGPARRQNCAMGNYAVIGAMWMASPAHQAALLDPTISYIGIAGYGAYWTFNAY